jgi:hypothetical protein
VLKRTRQRGLEVKYWHSRMAAVAVVMSRTKGSSSGAAGR